MISLKCLLDGYLTHHVHHSKENNVTLKYYDLLDKVYYNALSARCPKICAKNVENHDQIAHFRLLAKKENYLGDTNR